ncbi:MAG: DNA-binding response regulator [Calditrichaeota bacterium]|nr:MAG: DNA-binding response regulator [Calditrichota bacterium]
MRILIVEDEESLAQNIQRILLNENYKAECVYNGTDGLEQALTEEYDLIILDVMLPGKDGFEIIRTLRREGLDVPVIMLTARSQVEDKVRGLDEGADDYLTKPFAVPELLARVRSLLRRKSEVSTSVMQLGALELDTAARQARFNGQAVMLTPKEYAILEFLFYNKNRVVSRLSIAEHVWGDQMDLFTMTNFVDVHIKNLRKKLGDAAAYVQTVRGLGYMLKEPT